MVSCGSSRSTGCASYRRRGPIRLTWRSSGGWWTASWRRMIGGDAIADCRLQIADCKQRGFVPCHVVLCRVLQCRALPCSALFSRPRRRVKIEEVPALQCHALLCTVLCSSAVFCLALLSRSRRRGKIKEAAAVRCAVVSCAVMCCLVKCCGAVFCLAL